jgi:peptidoglycan/LPS O-acetylase OafA/YrhL
MKQRLWRVVSCLAALIAWGIFSRFYGYYFALRPSETFLVPRSVLNVILFFAYGSYGKFLEDFGIGMLISLLFIYAQQVSAEGKFNRGARRLTPWLWGTGIMVLVFLAMWRFNQGQPAWSFLQPLNSQFFWLGELGFSLGFGLCIFSILFGAPALKRPFEWRPLRWIGLISFSLYMWHLPLLIFFMTSVENHLHGWNPAAAFSLYWLWALLGIIPFSALSYLLVEKPGVAFGEKLWRRLEKQQQLPDKQAASAAANSEPENGATIERTLVK